MTGDFDALKPFIARVASGDVLDEADAEAAFEIIMSGGASDGQIGAFLMGLRVRGEAVSELTGAARIMRAKALAVPAPGNAVDTVGTGGDGSGTWNVSTAAAFVVAGAGVPVAKHGNRAVSSKSGAANVLAALGVNLDAEMELVARSIREAGVGFLLAPRHHSAMRHVMPVRLQMGTRTIFNMLGPLTNPAGVKRILVGVFAPEWVEPLAHVLAKLGCSRAWVVHGNDGLDELTTTTDSRVAELDAGRVSTFSVSPEAVGIKRAEPGALRGGDPDQNADALRALLDGAAGAYRDIVTLNAGATLVVAGVAGDLQDGVALAQNAIDSGAAKQSLERMVAITNEAAG